MRKPAGPRPVAELVPACLGPLAAKRGFAGAELVSRWPEIAGPEIARHTRPVRLQWPPRGEATDPERTAAAAVLVLRVESGFAMELQYQTGRLLDRINAYLGWRCVGQIRFRQGPVAAEPRSRPGLRELPAESAERLEGSLAGVEDGELARSLRRLGRAVLARSAVTAP